MSKKKFSSWTFSLFSLISSIAFRGRKKIISMDDENLIMISPCMQLYLLVLNRDAYGDK
jgi:hypothetical protein